MADNRRGLTNSYESAKYSFSGADAKAYFITAKEDGMEGFAATLVESLSTISVQTYEPVGRARALGHRGIKGFAHSVREIAGTMILTVVNDHPLRPLMNKTTSTTRWSEDKGKGFGSISGNQDILGAGLGNIVQESTSIGTLLGDFGLFIDYVSEYPKYDADFIPNFKLGQQVAGSRYAHGNKIGRIDADNDGNYNLDYKRTNFYQEMFTDRYLKLREEYLKGEGNRSYGGMFSNYGQDYSLMNRSFENPKGSGVLYNTGFESRSGNLLVTDDFREAFEKSIVQNPDFLKKEYRDDISKLIDHDPHYTTSHYYRPEIAIRENERAGLYIDGIRIISEGIVTSVNDMVTEMTFQFIAKDLKTISKLNNFKNDALRAEELQKILNNSKTRPFQLQQEMDALQAANPELRDMKTNTHLDKDGNLTTVILADSGTEWKTTTRKQRRQMYGKKK